MKEVILGVLSLPSGIMITSVSILIIVLMILKVKKSTLKKELKSQKSSKDEYINELIKIEKSSKTPKEKLNLLNNLSKRIFKEKYGFDQKLAYAELTEKLRKNGQEKLSIFSKQMSILYYTKRELSNYEINELINYLIRIITTTNHDSERINNKNLNLGLKQIKKGLDKGFKKSEYLNALQKNPGTYTDLKKSFELINKKTLDLNKLIKELYTRADKKTKREIKKITDDYKKQISKITRKTENPFKMYILQQKLLEEYFKKIELLK